MQSTFIFPFCLNTLNLTKLLTLMNMSLGSLINSNSNFINVRYNYHLKNHFQKIYLVGLLLVIVFYFYFEILFFVPYFFLVVASPALIPQIFHGIMTNRKSKINFSLISLLIINRLYPLFYVYSCSFNFIDIALNCRAGIVYIVVILLQFYMTILQSRMRNEEIFFCLCNSMSIHTYSYFKSKDFVIKNNISLAGTCSICLSDLENKKLEIDESQTTCQENAVVLRSTDTDFNFSNPNGRRRLLLVRLLFTCAGWIKTCFQKIYYAIKHFFILVLKLSIKYCCCIALKPKTVKQEMLQFMITPCNHVFHSECLEAWYEKKEICPICRRELPNVS